MVITKISFHGSGKTTWKIKVGATKIQPDGSDKKEITKKRLPLKYNHGSIKLKWKM